MPTNTCTAVRPDMILAPIKAAPKSQFLMRPRQWQRAFSFTVIGHLMEPAVDHGDEIDVDPKVPPRPGDRCVFIAEDGGGTVRALIRELVWAGADRWHVRQYNPPKDFDLSKKTWPRALTIIAKRLGRVA